MNRPFLLELKHVHPGNDLYAGWLKYALSLTRADILEITDKGLTYQAEAIRSMVREIIANQNIPTRLLKKLDLIVISSRKSAQALR